MFVRMVGNLQRLGEVKRRRGWRVAPKRRIITESHLREMVAGVVRCVDISPSAATRPCRSSGPLIDGAVLRPSPRQQLVELFHRPTVDEFGKNVGQIRLRVEVIQFCCLKALE
jgi:hypothetical protein